MGKPFTIADASKTAKNPWKGIKKGRYLRPFYAQNGGDFNEPRVEGFMVE